SGTVRTAEELQIILKVANSVAGNRIVSSLRVEPRPARGGREKTSRPPFLPGQETRSPDDFELFLEGILEAARGPRLSGLLPPLRMAPSPEGRSSPTSSSGTCCKEGVCTLSTKSPAGPSPAARRAGPWRMLGNERTGVALSLAFGAEGNTLISNGSG